MGIKIALLIPYRNDRPLFMENLRNMIKYQTLQPSIIEIVDYPAESDQVDITQRYKRGYEKLRNLGIDIISFMEVDDWYAPNYLEVMIAKWKEHGQPDLFGTAKTMYYHLQLKAYFMMEHHDRASAMNTFIKPDMNFPWPVDIEPFTDLHLWRTIPNRVVWMPDKWYSIGCKHGIGKTIAGGSHIIDDRVRRRYINPDNGFLKETLDAESFEFYWNYFN